MKKEWIILFILNFYATFDTWDILGNPSNKEIK